MPIAFVKSVSSSSGTAYQLSGGTTIEANAGSLLVIAIGNTGSAIGSTTSVTDGRGNTWTKAVDVVTNGGRNHSVWYAQNVNGGTTSIKFSFPTETYLAWASIVQEFSGVAPTLAIDAIGKTVDTNYRKEHYAATSAATTSTNQLVFMSFVGESTTTTYSTPAAFSNGHFSQGDGTFIGTACQSKVASTTGVQDGSIITSLEDQGATSIITFKEGPPPTIPATPTDIAASGSDRQVTVTWTASSGATSYTVKGSTTAGGPYTNLYTGKDTFTTQTGLTNGTTYYYRVNATNSAGTSADSAEVSAIPVAPPPNTVGDWHPFGVQPGLTISELRTKFRSRYDAWMAYTLTTDGCPVNARLPGTVKRIKVPDQGFFLNPDFNGSVSEGIAYGMFLKAILSNPALPTGIIDTAAKADFDAIYRYYDYYKNHHGLMNWNIKFDGTVADTGGATDGDLDAAMALLIMSRLHGDAGTINYGAEATLLIKAIGDWEFTPANYTGVGGPHVMMNGDMWGIDADNYMPDYFRSGWLREFYRHTGDTKWLDRLAKNYNLAIQYYHDNFQGGLVPDRVTRNHGSLDQNGKPVAGPTSNDLATYNSVRLGFGLMTDYLWNGPTVAPAICLQMMNKMANKAKANFAIGSKVKAPKYDLNFTKWAIDDTNPNGHTTADGGYPNGSGYGMIGPAALGDSANKTFVTEIYNAMANSTEQSYFNGGVALMAMAVMSGLAQPYSTVAPPTGTVGTVTWAPPVLVDPITIQLTNTDTGRKTGVLDPTKDYIVKMPAEPVTVANGIEINSGRNIVLVGGEIQFNVDYSTATDGRPNRCVFIKGNSLQTVPRIVHFEGVKFSGEFVREGINVDGQSEPGLIIQAQNIFCDAILKGTEAGHHADFIQVYNGPTELRVDRVKATTDYQFAMIQPRQFGTSPIGTYTWRRVEAIGTAVSGSLFYQVTGIAGETMPNNVIDRVYVTPNPNKVFPGQILDEQESFWQGVQNAVAPVSEGVTGNPGLKYVSPGYGTATAEPTSGVKIWNGTSWVTKEVRIWNGTSWVAKAIKRWNGTTWV